MRYSKSWLWPAFCRCFVVLQSPTPTPTPTHQLIAEASVTAALCHCFQDYWLPCREANSCGRVHYSPAGHATEFHMAIQLLSRSHTPCAVFVLEFNAAADLTPRGPLLEFLCRLEMTHWNRLPGLIRDVRFAIASCGVPAPS